MCLWLDSELLIFSRFSSYSSQHLIDTECGLGIEVRGKMKPETISLENLSYWVSLVAKMTSHRSQDLHESQGGFSLHVGAKSCDWSPVPRACDVMGLCQCPVSLEWSRATGREPGQQNLDKWTMYHSALPHREESTVLLPRPTPGFLWLMVLSKTVNNWSMWDDSLIAAHPQTPA